MLLAWIWQSAIGFEPAQISSDIKELAFVAESTRAVANEWFNASLLLSAGSCALMIIVLLFYPLTKKKSEEITKRLQSEASNMDEMGKGTKEEFAAAENALGGANAEESADESATGSDAATESAEQGDADKLSENGKHD